MKIKTLIIGAGPAGLQLGYEFKKLGRDYLIVEAEQEAASFFRKFPVHRKLLSINKIHTGKSDPEYNLRHDWNSLLGEGQGFSSYSRDYFPNADELVSYMNDFAAFHKLNIAFGTRVNRIQKSLDVGFDLCTSKGDVLSCENLIIATGLSKPFIPEIPGIDLAIGYEDLDPTSREYVNKKVLILGKGNSALETADALIPYAAVIHLLSPNPVSFAWDTGYVGHVRAVNNSFFDTYHLKSQNASMDGQIERIWVHPKTRKYIVRFQPYHAPMEIEQIEYDAVIRCTGFRFADDIFSPEVKPKRAKDERFPDINADFSSTNIPNLYFAGVMTQAINPKKNQSGFIHGFRYNCRTLARLIVERYDHIAYPIVTLNNDPRGLAVHMIQHLNRVSSLWQQARFLCDVYVPSGELIECYRDLPFEYVLRKPKVFGDFFVISLFDLRTRQRDVFNAPRSSGIYEGEDNSAIHPVFHLVKDGVLVDSFHVLEDLMSDWDREEYIASVEACLRSYLRGEIFLPEIIASKTTREIVRSYE